MTTTTTTSPRPRARARDDNDNDGGGGGTEDNVIDDDRNKNEDGQVDEGQEESGPPKTEAAASASTSVVLVDIRRLLRLAKLDDRLLLSQSSPPSSSQLRGITKLDLSDCGLSSLPDDLPEALPNLSVLFLSNNRFRQMPAVVGRCRDLRMVAFRANGMESVHPDAFQSQLRWLILTDNLLEELPETIGRCTALQKCMLSGNRLLRLPDAVAGCTGLELIRLASNRLTEPPIPLLKLPNLCWVGMSDNPFLTATAATASSSSLRILDDVPEGEGEILGQGAGGVTRKVRWQGRDVAVKTYKEGMTSDGLPSQERRISRAASALRCRCLVDVLGETARSKCLVMEYLNDFVPLAGPPSLETCSRDVYPGGEGEEEGGGDGDGSGWSFTREQSERMLGGLLDALVRLHKAGICHGDFYAHNILVEESDPSNVRLTDFGAAFFYDPDSDYAPLLQRIELRAFSVLVEEVSARTQCCPVASESFRKRASTCRQEEARLDDVHVSWKQEQLSAMAQSVDAELNL